jgi:hypothetical protein
MYALDDELADLRRGLFMDVVEDLHHSMQKKERKKGKSWLRQYDHAFGLERNCMKIDVGRSLLKCLHVEYNLENNFCY